MSETYLWVKWVHVLSSTLLFGTGLGTAFHLYATHLRGDVAAIASAARNTTLADWLFIATSIDRPGRYHRRAPRSMRRCSGGSLVEGSWRVASRPRVKRGASFHRAPARHARSPSRASPSPA